MLARGRTGRIEFDGQFVTISRTRLISRISVGKGQKRIPIASITAVQLKPAGWIINGYIQFTLAGGNEVRARFGNQTYSAALDENSVTFDFLKRKQFRELYEAVLKAIGEQTPPRVHVATASGPTRLEQLTRLGELRSEGVLTPDEFEAEKSRILRGRTSAAEGGQH